MSQIMHSAYEVSMKKQTAVAEPPQTAQPAARTGVIDLPYHLRGRCALRHGQRVDILGEVEDKYLVTGEGIRGTMPARKQYVRENLMS